MAEDLPAIRQFLRREREEWIELIRSWPPASASLGFATFREALRDPRVEVSSTGQFEEVIFHMHQKVGVEWKSIPVGYGREEEMIVSGLAFVVHRELGIRMVLQIADDDGTAVLKTIVREDDQAVIGRIEAWLDGLLDGEHHPLRGKLLKIETDRLSFLPAQSVSREDVVLPEDILEELERNFAFLRGAAGYPEPLRHRAILLAGPPGVGKTLVCKWLSGIVEATVLWTSPQALWSAGPGEILELARRLRPALLILEDLDVAAGRRDGSTPLGDLLSQLDGFGSLEDIGLVATTNHPEVLDHALDPRSRPGRFQLFMELGVMEPELRRRLLGKLVAQDQVLLGDSEAAVERLFRATSGFTGAQVAGIVRDLELIWLWEKERGRRPTLEAVVEKALNGRPSITRVLGFAAGEGGGREAAVASAAGPDRRGGAVWKSS